MTAMFTSLSVSGNPFCPSSSSFEDNGTSETHWWRPLLLSSSSPTSRFSVCLWTSLCLYCSMTSTATHCHSSTSSTRETCPSWAHNICPMPAWPSSFSSPLHCCQCCCSSSTPAPVSRPASTTLAAAASPYTPSMDTFQGHYKNGTNATHDLRYFYGLYLLLRVVVYASTVVTYQLSSYSYTTAIIAVLAVSVAL